VRISGTRLTAPLLAALVLLVSSHAKAAPSPSKTIRSKRGKGGGGGKGNFGLGLSLGAPTGMTMKLFLHPNHALQWNLGWMPLHHNSGGITMSYLWAPANFVSNSVMDFFGYLGIGFGAFLWTHRYYWYHSGVCHEHGGYGWHCHDADHDDHGHYNDRHAHGGILWRLPVLGLAFHWKKVPMDTVIEGSWSPAMPEFVHGARVHLPHGEFSVKGRYYF
jgi:hypothetical protein